MLRISSISFPGLGIGEFKANSVAFTVFGREVAWYAVIIALGMVAAVAYVIFRSTKIGITAEDILDAVLFVIPIGILGARLYYVIFNGGYSSLIDIINISKGGLAIYGGIIAGGLTVLVFCKVKKIRFTAFADCVCPGLILAQAIGRWGNFMNGEAFGAKTDSFLRMGLSNALTAYDTIFVHPTFLYESLWNLLGFVLINLFYKHKKYDGQIFLLVFGWYGLGRMFIEGLRQDSLYIGIFRISQLLAFLIFSVCLAALIYFAIKKPKNDFFTYQSKYKNKTKSKKGK